MTQIKHYELGELANVTKLAGFEFTKYIKYNNYGKIIALRALNLRHGELDLTDIKRIDRSVSELLPRSKLYINDILLTYTGNGYGDCAIIEENDKYHLAPNICKIAPNVEKVVPYYLYSYIRTNEFYKIMSSHMTGSSQPTIPMKTIRVLPIPLPPIVVQEKIAEVAYCINEKIRKNNAINKNLLQQLHVLYLKLFCDSAMDTPLGDVVATTSGGTPSRKHDEYYSDSSICWVKSKELLGNYIHETEEHINDLAIKKSSAKLLPEHSVLIAMYGATVGAYGVISKPMTCNQAVCALLCNENYPYTYLFQIAYESQQKFINLAVGSAQQNISQVLIKQLNLHSDLDIIQRFHDLALPMHQEIEFLQAENIRLSDLRDNLLPKLMSGELDVSQIDI